MKMQDAPFPREDWDPEHGPVLWWAFPVTEPPYCGSPLDEGWPGYHTHWTPFRTPRLCEVEGHLWPGEGDSWQRCYVDGCGGFRYRSSKAFPWMYGTDGRDEDKLAPQYGPSHLRIEKAP